MPLRGVILQVDAADSQQWITVTWPRQSGTYGSMCEPEVIALSVARALYDYFGEEMLRARPAEQDDV